MSEITVDLAIIIDYTPPDSGCHTGHPDQQYPREDADAAIISVTINGIDITGALDRDSFSRKSLLTFIEAIENAPS